MSEDKEHPLVRQIEQEYKTSHPSPSPGMLHTLSFFEMFEI